MIISAGRDDTSILICLTARHHAPDLRISVAVNAEDNEIPAKRAGADVVVNPLDFAGLLLATTHGGSISPTISPTSPRAKAACSSSNATSSRRKWESR